MGSILPYVGSLADIPVGWHLCDGTDGTPNLLDGRFLEGANIIGMYKEPGIPNIKGEIGVDSSFSSFAKLSFYPYNGISDSNRGISHDDSRETAIIAFDAARSSSIYRNDVSTVQPQSFTVMYIIKIK